MKHLIWGCAALLLVSFSVQAESKKPKHNKKPKHDIVVMTQNQYLGASLSDILSSYPNQINKALLEAVIQIRRNNTRSRLFAQAESIAARKPHLVGLQEVIQLSCDVSDSENFAFDPCSLIEDVLIDHLAITMQHLGSRYEVAASQKNLSLKRTVSIPLNPTNPEGPSVEVMLSVLDRDVILVRSDVNPKPSIPKLTCGAFPKLYNTSIVGEQGCTYEANISLGDKLSVDRGFVAVDVEISDRKYRFVNTHLEVASFGVVQGVQATELLYKAMAWENPDVTNIVVGDFNSGPADFDTELSAYRVLTLSELSTHGLGSPLIDIWPLRPGKPKGYTCCQDADLLNTESEHSRRIDLILTSDMPSRVKANVIGNDPEDKTVDGLWLEDKTVDGLWPSDHSGVAARLNF